jgi:fumarate hydratase class II
MATSANTGEYRIEHDSLGDVRVPAHARWGAQTQRAVENFPISGLRLEPRLIRALALIKAESARANAKLGVLDPTTARAIASAADEVAEGAHDEQFPIDVYQTGSGTSSNMNANEVIASLARDVLGDDVRVHPNDDVNASQSSNDVFPSAVHVATVDAVVHDLLPALRVLERSLRRKQRDFTDVVKAGRTHLMDAVPVTLGQEFGGYASQIHDAAARIEALLPRVGALALGGTAVGTGLNAPKGFARRVIRAIATRTGLPLSEARDHFAAQAARDDLVAVSGELRALAVALVKIANDLRWLGSGPRAGLAEIHIPDLQPGSSIMPGKVNPVIPEAVVQVAAQVFGNDTTVAFCGAQGAFELNVTVPAIARNVLESIRLLSSVSTLFARRCIDGIEADAVRARTYAESSPAIVTALNPYIGYEAAAEVAKQAVREGRTIREVVLERKLLDAATLDRALDVMAMAKPYDHR